MKPQPKRNRLYKFLLYGMISCILSIFILILFWPFLPDLAWPNNLDKVLILILLLGGISYLIKIYKPFIVVISTGIVLVYIYQARHTNYNLLRFYNDGRSIFTNLQMSHNSHFVYARFKSLSTDKTILKAIDYNNPSVRDFAVKAASTYFRVQQQNTNDKNNTWQLIQSLAIFKTIQGNWNYVSDPSNEEYFAKASESIKLLAGDCDDYSIAMAGCIKAIGGKCRLVCVDGHIYPELFVGSKKEFYIIAKLITRKLFASETKGQKLNYHEDDERNIWLNLDYTANYPGGEFMSNNVIEYIYP